MNPYLFVIHLFVMGRVREYWRSRSTKRAPADAAPPTYFLQKAARVPTVHWPPHVLIFRTSRGKIMEAFLKGQIRSKAQTSEKSSKGSQKSERRNIPWVEK